VPDAFQSLSQSVLDHALHHLQGNAQLEMDDGFGPDAIGGGFCALRFGGDAVEKPELRMEVGSLSR
jgi:hypothetical protein